MPITKKTDSASLFAGGIIILSCFNFCEGFTNVHATTISVQIQDSFPILYKLNNKINVDFLAYADT